MVCIFPKLKICCKLYHGILYKHMSAGISNVGFCTSLSFNCPDVAHWLNDESFDLPFTEERILHSNNLCYWPAISG